MIKPIIYDIEVFYGMFLFCGFDPETGEVFSFELSHRKDEISKMINFLNEREDYHFVGFNNLKYDSQIVEYIIRNYGNWTILNQAEILERIKKFSNEVIEGQKYEEWSPFSERSLSFKQVDLLKIHHFDNKNRRASLKWIAFMMDVEDIEELPFPHYQKEFSDEELDHVIEYCWKDISNTFKFYQYTIGETEDETYKGKNKIQDRLDIIEELGFGPETINFSDVKIGDEINKRGYCAIKGISEKQLKAVRAGRKATRKITYGDCIPTYVEFKSDVLKSFLEKVKNVKVYMGEDQDKQTFKIKFQGNIYVIARGGIHTKEGARVLKPNPNEILRDADVGSQHPRAIIKRRLYPDHLGPEWLISYEQTADRRMVYKDAGKKNKRMKGLSDTFKLALNGGGFGKTIDKTNWQYGPEVGFGCTIGNQFEILMLVEMLELIGVKVVSANTDGVVSLLDKSLEGEYNEVCKKWELIVGNSESGKLEYADFKLLAQESVNHYIAIKSDGELKIKGRLSVACEVNKNNTKDLGRIERKAIVKYFSEGIPIEKTILDSQNIFDFFIGMKASKDYHYETVSVKGEKEELKRVIRFYISKKGPRLIKVKNEESEATGAQVTKIVEGRSVVVMNKIKKLQDFKDYNIDYQFYIDRAEAIISRIEGKNTLKNQLLLF